MDVDELAKRLDVTVRRLRMDHDGQLIPTGAESAYIHVREDQPEARQRFVIAHEIAHWSTRHERIRSPIVDSVAAWYRSEERYANAVAGAILVPHDWLVELLSNEPALASPSLSNLVNIARRANASLEATVIQLRSALAWEATVVHWTRETTGWTFAGEAGLPVGHLSYVRPTRITSEQLTAAGVRTSLPQTWPLQLSIGRSANDYVVQVMVRAKDAVAFVDHATIRLADYVENKS